jgi:hypothetical protein
MHDGKRPLRAGRARGEFGGNRYTGWVQSTQGNQNGRVSVVQHGNRLSVTVTSRQGIGSADLGKAWLSS